MSAWPTRRIGDFARTASGGTPKRNNPAFFGGAIPWVKSGELNDGIVVNADETITLDGLSQSSAKVFAKGTLCIALYGATVGKLGVLGMDAATNQAVCGIFLPPEVETKYLFHFLAAEKETLVKLGKGGAQPNISQEVIRNINVPIPPLEEQRRIVAEIEERLSRLEAGVAALKRVQANLKRYRASAISEPFVTLENQGDTLWQTGREVFEFVTSGSRGWAKYYSGSGSFFLRVGNIRRENIQLDLRDIQHVVPPPGAEGLRTRVEVGDILVTITADVGRVGLVDAQLAEAYVNQHVALARPKNGLNSRFIAWYLASHIGNRQLRVNERGATRTGLGLDDIWAAQVPSIDIAVQDSIVAEIDRRLSVVEELETQVIADLARATRLRQATLEKAFRQSDTTYSAS